VGSQKSYETKQYKKGLKASDSILKRVPEHGGIFLPDFLSSSQIIACRAVLEGEP
jgi:hypothetical protein